MSPSRSPGALPRRAFLRTMAAPVAMALAGGSAAPSEAPVQAAAAEPLPERRDPDVEAVRALSFPVGSEPAFVFRASPNAEP